MSFTHPDPEWEDRERYNDDWRPARHTWLTNLYWRQARWDEANLSREDFHERQMRPCSERSQAILRRANLAGRPRIILPSEQLELAARAAGAMST